VGDEQRNAASEAGRIVGELRLNPERVNELASMLADDYVQQDRRKIVGQPDHNKAALIEDAVWFGGEVGYAAIKLEVLAVDGDRLAVTRVAPRYGNDFENEFLTLIELDEACSLIQRVALFDVDDLDVAMTELDRLHAEIEE
jgi:hypothetical protein